MNHPHPRVLMHNPSLLIMYSTALLIDSCAIMHFWLSCPVPPLWQVPVVLTVVCCGSYSFTHPSDRYLWFWQWFAVVPTALHTPLTGTCGSDSGLLWFLQLYLGCPWLWRADELTEGGLCAHPLRTAAAYGHGHGHRHRHPENPISVWRLSQNQTFAQCRHKTSLKSPKPLSSTQWKDDFAGFNRLKTVCFKLLLEESKAHAFLLLDVC